MEVIPGILEKEWRAIQKKLELVKPFAKTVHIDLLDGKFAPNTTLLDPTPFKEYTKDMLFELHMMVAEPIEYLESFAKAGFRRFIGHIEKMSDQQAFVTKGKEFGEVGLAIDGPAPLTQIEVPYTMLDVVLVMTITAGFSGQRFVASYLDKLVTLKQHTGLPLEVDGGITDLTIRDAKEHGAVRFVSTSFLFREASPQEQFLLLQKQLV